MTKIVRCWIVAAAALAAFTSGASAQIRLNPPTSAPPSAPPAPSTSGDGVTKVTVEQLSKVLQEAGYRAEIVTTSKRPYIRTGLSGRRVAIYLYDCTGNDCTSYQFSAIYNKNTKFTVDYVNEWNKKKRFAKAYLDNDGDLNFEWDVDLDGGVTPAYLKQTVLAFERSLGIFDNFTP